MIFRKILAALPMQAIGNGHHIDTFFRRYTLFKCRFGAVYLHEFLRSDQDRCLHDHPWGFVSLILRGGYWEEMKDGKHWRRAGSLLFRRATVAHRIVVEEGTKPWSMVIVGRKVRPWGFWTKFGWVAWDRNNPNPICETN